jgi:hypothetical protein
MHQLILITAMTATTGLFGGKHCGKTHHAKKAVSASSCYSASPCGATTYASPAPIHYGAAPAASYPASPQAYPSAPAKSAPLPPTAPPAPTPSSPPVTGS